MVHELLANLDKIHTTVLGVERIRNNLNLDTDDVVAWCIEKIQKAAPDDIIRNGKNWYVQSEDIQITIHAKSYTIITAHKGKPKMEHPAPDGFTKEELREALRAVESTILKCEKVLPKLKEGTPQHTLLTRRIKAFQISASLINKELNK